MWYNIVNHIFFDNRCILSVSWVLHIILFTIEKAIRDWNHIDSFLNNMLIAAASVASFFATFLYIIFAVYLFLCVVKGNQKLGMRVFFVAIHPLKYVQLIIFRVGDTLMSGLVFNAGVLLTTSLPIAQFLTISFSEFGILTQNNCKTYIIKPKALFGIQLQTLAGFNYAYAALIFLLLLCLAITSLYYSVRPYRKQKENMLSFNLK